MSEPQYPYIELARTDYFIGRWMATIRYGPEIGEWCCISHAFTKEGAIRAARHKWEQRQKPYVPPVVVETVPL